MADTDTPRDIDLDDITRVTWGHANHEHPSWSPDGKRIAYYAGEYGWIQIYISNTDGTAARPLTSARGNHTQAYWSHDGRYIYYRRQASPISPWELWRAVADDPGDKECLLADRKVSFKHPSPSPDGKRLAWFSDQGSPGNFHIFVAPLGARRLGQPQQLTSASDRNDCHPTWSPDGKWLAFHAYMGASEAATSHVYVIAAAGGPPRRITDTEAFHKHPFFVGKTMIVHHTETADGRRRLVLRRFADGEVMANLTSGKRNDKHPNPFVPRRGLARIAFSSKHRGHKHEDGDEGRATYDIFVGTLRGVRVVR